MTPIEREIEADRETWIERVNMHLEKLFEKENKEKNMLRHMKNHYWARTHVCKARIKILKARLRRALRRRQRHDRLQILAEASLAKHGTRWGTFSPNLKEFGENFFIFEFFGHKTGFYARCVAPPCARLWLGDLLEEKLIFLDFFTKIFECSRMA